MYLLHFDFLTTGAPPAEFKVFKVHYSALKNILFAENLSQHFVSADLISFQDEAEIFAASTSVEKATILLQKIVSPLESGQSFYFHEMLKIMNTYGNRATKDLANKMQLDLSVEESKPKVALTSQVTISPLIEVQPPPERATLHQQPMLPHGTREGNSFPITAAISSSPDAVGTTDKRLEHTDLKGTEEEAVCVILCMCSIV